MGRWSTASTPCWPRFSNALIKAHPKEWLKALEQNPGGLANLEQEIHRTFAQMADRVVAGLLAQATADSAFADSAKKK